MWSKIYKKHKNSSDHVLVSLFSTAAYHSLLPTLRPSPHPSSLVNLNQQKLYEVRSARVRASLRETIAKSCYDVDQIHSFCVSINQTLLAKVSRLISWNYRMDGTERPVVDVHIHVYNTFIWEDKCSVIESYTNHSNVEIRGKFWRVRSRKVTNWINRSYMESIGTGFCDWSVEVLREKQNKTITSPECLPGHDHKPGPPTFFIPMMRSMH